MPKKKSRLSPHDRYARSSLLQPKVAREFFNEHLPVAIKKCVDLSSLAPQKESYINDKLHAKVVDILFSVDFAGEDGYLYLLIEHASTPDPLLPLRMLQYVLAIMEEHCRRTGESKLPIVFPMIFYTGRKEYKHSTNIYDLFGKHKKLSREK
ncbi:MAG: Rpn family recombination-promoting nuclease/putative transposase [Pseudomonadota bacterium]